MHLAVWCPFDQGSILGPVGFVVAFFVGAISFFSPCVLPLLPGYLSFASGLSGEKLAESNGKSRVVAGVSLFVLGFAVMFTALGGVAGALGSYLTGHLEVINRVAGVIVLLLGIAFLAPGIAPFLEQERRPFLSRARPGVAGAFPLGLAFAAGWIPCVGPGLGVMLTLGAQEGSVLRASVLLFFFSLGFGVWFVLAALGIDRLFGHSSWIRRNSRALQMVGGVFMLAIGILLVTNKWNDVLAPARRFLSRSIFC